MSELAQFAGQRVTARWICFVDRITDGDVVMMRFRDPAASYAVLCGEGAGRQGGDVLAVTLLPAATSAPGGSAGTQLAAEWMREANEERMAPPVFVKYRGVEVMWRPGSAALQCEDDQVEPLLAAVVEFTHFEAALRRIEEEIAHAWDDLEEDKGLAFDATVKDLKRSKTVGVRMGRVLQWRIRFARMEPYLWAPGAKLPAASHKLGEELRERAGMEARIEAVEGQLEVFEHVYELGSQRMGESRLAHETQIVEWIIIVLLAGEALMMMVQVFWKHGG